MPACRNQELEVGQLGEKLAVEPGSLAHGHDHRRAVQRGDQVVTGQMLADSDPLRPVRTPRQRILPDQPLVVVQGHHPHRHAASSHAASSQPVAMICTACLLSMASTEPGPPTVYFVGRRLRQP